MLKGLIGRAGGALLVGVPVGGVTLSVGNTVATLARLPQLVKEFYGMVWAHELIGPNLKTAVSAAAPTVIAAVPPLTAIGSAVVGAGYGFYRGFMSLNEVYPKTKEIAEYYGDGALQPLIEEMAGYRPMLAPGQVPFDIRLVEAVKGAVAAHLVAPAAAAGFTAVLLRHWPRAYRQGIKAIWSETDRRMPGDSPLRFLAKLAAAAATDGFSILAVGAVPLTPVAGYFFSFGESFVEGYRRGIRSAIGQAKSRVEELNRHLGEFCRE